MGRAEDARRMGEEGKTPPLFDPNFDMQAYRQGKISRRPVSFSAPEAHAGELSPDDINRYRVLNGSGAATAQAGPAASGITAGRALFFLFALVAGAGMVKLAMMHSAAQDETASTTAAVVPLPVAAPEPTAAPAAPRTHHVSDKQTGSFVIDVRSADTSGAATTTIRTNEGRSVPTVAAPVQAPAAPPPMQARTLVATHEKALGEGCEGQLTLAASGLTFECPYSPKESFSVGIAELKPDKNGVQTSAGKKLHFKSNELSKDQMEAMFASWLQGAR